MDPSCCCLTSVKITSGDLVHLTFSNLLPSLLRSRVSGGKSSVESFIVPVVVDLIDMLGTLRRSVWTSVVNFVNCRSPCLGAVSGPESRRDTQLPIIGHHATHDKKGGRWSSDADYRKNFTRQMRFMKCWGMLQFQKEPDI